MKNTLIFVLISFLLLSSCKQFGDKIIEVDNIESITGIAGEDYDKYAIPVDKDKIVTSYEVSENDYFHLSGLLANNYAVVQTQSYEKWTRTYAVFYPPVY